MELTDTPASAHQSKTHFYILDGLRGVAALAVVVFHFMEWIFVDASKNFIGHGFLAVDFFFCLSGFVIGYAYDYRIASMGLLQFFKARIIRLHPLVIVGSVLGLLAFMFDPFSSPNSTYSAAYLFKVFICSVLLIPLPIMPERGLNLFSFNAPSWSLFWEYVANIFYALVLFKTKRRLLQLLTIIAAIILGTVAYRSGNLLGGWSGPTFWDGGARIAYSFLAGLLIYRSNWVIKNNLDFLGLSALLILAFILPSSTHNWLLELLVVLLYFPLLIALGAGAMLSVKLKQGCILSGKLSYPLYMTHYATLWMFGNYFNAYKPGTVQLTFIIITAIILLVAFAYIIMVTVDAPVRKLLNAKYNRHDNRKG